MKFELVGDPFFVAICGLCFRGGMLLVVFFFFHSCLHACHRLCPEGGGFFWAVFSCRDFWENRGGGFFCFFLVDETSPLKVLREKRGGGIAPSPILVLVDMGKTTVAGLQKGKKGQDGQKITQKSWLPRKNSKACLSNLGEEGEGFLLQTRKEKKTRKKCESKSCIN